MPTKRVSLKGKGADLFFGPAPVPAAESSPVPTEEPIAGPSEVSGDTTADPLSDAAAVLPAPAHDHPKQGRVHPSARGAERQWDMSRDEDGDKDKDKDETAVTAAPHAHVAAAMTAMAAEAPAHAETVERIRKTVKEIGREVAFTRLSPTEKGRLADIVYTYKRQGVKTSENEINRIAINLMLNDYEVNGEESVLARVLAALQA